MKTIRFRLAIRKISRFPDYAVRAVGRGRLRAGEILFPMVMEIPDAILSDRKPTVTITIPEPPAPKAKVES